MHLILSGGGSGEDTKELDQKFSFLLNKNKPLLYIPIAIDNIKHPYIECLKWLKSTFDNLGIKKYEMWTEDDLINSNYISPDNFSGIYIGGGNTPYLLKKLKETRFWEFLKKAIKLNIPIYGGSAGALIFSKTIANSLYEDKNWVELKNLNGMNILNNCDLIVHYKTKNKDIAVTISKNNKTTQIIALTEKNGLNVTDNGISLLGKEQAYIFNKGKIKKINPGDIIF